MNAIVVNDLDVNLTEEVLAQLAMEDSLNDEFGQLSLHTMSAADHAACIKLKALVQNKTMLLLVDSGSSHSFVSSKFLQLTGLQPVPVAPKQVKLPNGQVLLSTQMVPQLSWWYQGHTVTTDMRVLDLDVYDGILGFDWLSNHSPMQCNWVEKTLAFPNAGHTIKLQGLQSQPLDIFELSYSQLLKWCKGNEVWAYAIVEHCPPSTVAQHPPPIQALLAKYSDLFL